MNEKPLDDFIIISFHGYNENSSKHCSGCHEEWHGELEAERRIHRAATEAEAIEYIAELNFQLSLNPHRGKVEWEHTVIWWEHFDRAAVQAGWSDRFNDAINPFCWHDAGGLPDSWPEQIGARYKEKHAEAMEKALVEAEAKNKAAAQAEQAKAAAEAKAAEERERAELERLLNKHLAGQRAELQRLLDKCG